MIDNSNVPYQLTAMGTIIETDTLAEALTIVQHAYDVLESSGCNRVYSSLKIDIRKGNNSNRLQGKVQSVTEKTGKLKSL
jgi:uncharacterized protein YqgV (UPF0045/DUF77 family)